MTRSRRQRTIQVDGIAYGFNVRFTNQSHVTVRAWLLEPDRRRQLRVDVRFDDPWLHYGEIITAPPGRAAEVFQLEPVRPRLVEGLIRAGIAAGWDPQSSGAATHFTMTGADADRPGLIAVTLPQAQRRPVSLGTGSLVPPAEARAARVD